MRRFRAAVALSPALHAPYSGRHGGRPSIAAGPRCVSVVNPGGRTSVAFSVDSPPAQQVRISPGRYHCHMRLTAFLILLTAAAGCASLPAPVAAPLDPECAVLVADAQAAFERGDFEVAESLAARVLERYPGNVDALRLRQNLRMAAGEEWRVYEEAARARAADPSDAGLTYLYARTIPDREIQVDLFKQVITLDPSLFWGWYGLGVAALDLNDPAIAVAAARGALEVRPDDARAMVLLAASLERAGDRLAADELYGMVLREEEQTRGALLAAARRCQATGRSQKAVTPVLDGLTLAPDSPSLLAMVWTLLKAPDIPDAEVRRALDLAADSEFGISLLLRARCRYLLGDPKGALDALNAAARTSARGFVDHDEWFTVAVAAADYAQAATILQSARPAILLDSPVNSRGPYVDRLCRALDAAASSPGSRNVQADLSRALSGCGFTDAAVNCAARALAASPGGSASQVLLGEALAWQAFLGDVRLEFARQRAGVRAGDPFPSIKQVAAAISRASLRRLGRDLLEGISVQSYPFVGEVLRTDSPGAPPEWVERGTLLVVGQRAGAPVAAVFARLVGHMAHLLEADVEHDLAFARGSSISIEDGVLGAIAGFTLPGWIIVDLDVVDRSGASLRRAAAEARPADLWPARDESTRRSTWFPGGVRGRLAAKIGEPGDRVLLATLAHERGHAVDADQYMPFVRNLPLALVEFARHGFSPSKVEVGLERTAEIWSLHKSPDRRVALTNTLNFLPHERSAPPHSVAYHGIVTELIAEIDRHPEDYPSIDRGFNILQQLDRLADGELEKLISRALR
jgi:tetratricopeptide (TPR) repeat protein